MMAQNGVQVPVVYFAQTRHGACSRQKRLVLVFNKISPRKAQFGTFTERITQPRLQRIVAIRRNGRPKNFGREVVACCLEMVAKNGN